MVIGPSTPLRTSLEFGFFLPEAKKAPDPRQKSKWAHTEGKLKSKWANIPLLRVKGGLSGINSG